MLEKMGWKKGEGLGKEGTGMKDPVRLFLNKQHNSDLKKHKKKINCVFTTFTD